MPPVKNESTKPRKRGPSPAVHLTWMQEKFVAELMVDEHPTEAAKRAGYSPKSAEQQGQKLLDPKRHPAVVRAVEKARAERNARALKTGDDVLRYVQQAMFFNPLKWFEPSENGWMISPERYKELPDEVAQFIEEMQIKDVTSEDAEGNKKRTKMYWVKLVSKGAMASVAAKYQLTSKTQNDVKVQLQWEEMYGVQKAKNLDPKRDTIESQIDAVNQLALPNFSDQESQPSSKRLPPKEVPLLDTEKRTP